MNHPGRNAHHRLMSLLALLIFAAFPTRAEQPKTVRLLTVGNSFADNALVFLPRIAESAGHKLIFAKANLGGCTLERHWKHLSAYEANRDDPAGRPYSGGKKSLYELLKQDQWERVTIQQQSLLSCDAETYLPFAEKLHEYIRAHAPTASVLIHQTWPYRVDDALYRTANPGKGPSSHRDMYEKTRAAYRQIAAQLKISIIPSGEAMFKADIDPLWGYKPDTTFDFTRAMPKSVPIQKNSLHTGWVWKVDKKDNVEKLTMDGHHASIAGQYLIGCVWYETLFKTDATKVTFAPKEIDPPYATFLRQVAHDVVAEMGKPPQVP